MPLDFGDLLSDLNFWPDTWRGVLALLGVVLIVASFFVWPEIEAAIALFTAGLSCLILAAVIHSRTG